MSNAARKTRKRIRYAALAAGDTKTAEAYAFESEPKRPTTKYTTVKERRAKRKEDRKVAAATQGLIAKAASAVSR